MNVSEWIVAEMERREAVRQAEWDAEMAAPSVLARNLIRAGLNTRPDQTLSDAVEQLETAVEQLRALVP